MNVSSVPNIWSVSPYHEHTMSCICHHIMNIYRQWVVSPGCELYVPSCARVIGNEIRAGQPYLLSRFFLFWVLKSCELSYEYLQCLQFMICVPILWSVSVCSLWATEHPYCERLQAVRFVRLHIMNIYRLRVLSPWCKLYISSCVSRLNATKLTPLSVICDIQILAFLITYNWTMSVFNLWSVFVTI